MKKRKRQKKIKCRFACFMALILGMLEVSGAVGITYVSAASTDTEDSSLSAALQTARAEGHWLSEGETGEISVTQEMEDMYFSPDEDGAWTLSLQGEGYGSVAYMTMFLVYEWQDGAGWMERDCISGPCIKSVGNGYRWKMSRNINGYYRKGACYKIEFSPSVYEEGGQECTLSYCFQRSALAGNSTCEDGSYVWRTAYESYDLSHMDSETLDTEDMTVQIMQMPETSEVVIPETLDGYAVTACSNDYMQKNETIETIRLAGTCKFGFDFNRLPALKAIYVNDMNSGYVFGGMASSQVPETVTIYCRADSEMEYECLENDWSYQLLEESETAAPTGAAIVPSIQTETPTPAESAQPSLTPSADRTGQPAPTQSALLSTPTAAWEENPLPTETPTPPAPTAAREESPAPTESSTAKPTAAPQESSTPTQNPSFSTPADTPQESPMLTENAPTPIIAQENVSSTESPAETAQPVSSITLSADTDRYTYVMLQWKGTAVGRYEIFRSVNQKTFRKIETIPCTGSKKKWTYQDDTVSSGNTYYYKVLQKKKQSGTWNTIGQSQQIHVKIRQLQTPVISIVKKRTGTVSCFRAGAMVTNLL